MKVEVWSNEEAKKQLSRRLSEAKAFRKKFESTWRSNEEAIYQTRLNSNVGYSIQTKSDLAKEEEEHETTSDININYVMRDVRMIHSQMSANPPAVAARPTSPDFSDRRAADAADRLVRHGMRTYSFPEKFDMANLNVLIYGIDYVKGIHNPDEGDILDYDDKTGEITLEGDYDLSVPSPWDVYPDPQKAWDKVRYVFEGIDIDKDDAKRQFKGKESILKKLCDSTDEYEGREDGGDYHHVRNRPNTVRVYQYWEKGFPHNGMAGRFCWCTESGDLLTDIVANPHAFSRLLKTKDKDGNEVERKMPPVARLPYHIKTDIDIPDTFYGHSIIAYSSAIQRVMNQIDNVSLDCAKAHGIPRLIMPEGCDVADDSITNSPWDFIKTTGNRDPKFMEPMPMPAVMNVLRDRYANDIMQVDGVNESLFGQQSREQAGFLMQYATQQSNMTRKRLFNKYVKQVEMIYRDYLDIIREKWSIARTIKVLGKEKAFETADIKGADISGGFDLVIEYGTSLSLDPIMRRDEIIKLMPILEKAGISPRTMLGMMRLNEIERAYDIVQLAEDRQREYFEEMHTTKEFIPPQEMEDHKNYLEFAYSYLNSAEFKYLPVQTKDNIVKHVKEREVLSKKEVTSDVVGEDTPPPEAPAAPAEGGGLGNLGALLGI